MYMLPSSESMNGTHRKVATVNYGEGRYQKIIDQCPWQQNLVVCIGVAMQW